MKIGYVQTARLQLKTVRDHIAKDNPHASRAYLRKLRKRLESMLQFPFVGKINPVYEREDIRETAIDGFKVIYLVEENQVTVLAIYKHIDFDFAQIMMDHD